MRAQSNQESFSVVDNREWRWRWTALILGTLVLGIGCGPANLYFLMPWLDDNVPAQVDLTASGKEVTLVIMASFANPMETRPEFQTVDRELCERVAQNLKKRYEGNKKKVKIVPYYKVKSYLNKSVDGNIISKREIGKEFKADYVINMEINSMSFYEGSYRQLYRGNTEIVVTVFKMDQPSGEGPMFEDIYHTEYPSRGPIDASNSSVLQFRALFLNRIGKDLSKYFAAYPNDEKYDFD